MWKKNVFTMYSVKNLFLLSISLCLFGACTDDSDSYTYGVWADRSDFDGNAREGAAAFTIGTMGYVCGGYDAKDYLRDLWVYNIEGNYWTQCASMPDEAIVRTGAAGFAVNNKGYVTTGYYGKTALYLKDTWEYDPASNTWEQKDDFGSDERYNALAFSIGNYGYVGTGADKDSKSRKDFYRFDPTAAPGTQWEIVNGFGGNKRSGGTAFVINNVAYICTGINNGSYVYDFWKFDPSAAEPWTKLREIADESDDDYDDDYIGIVRAYAVSFVIDGKGYLTTGRDGSGLKTDYWVYDPATDLWDSEDFTPFEGSSRKNAVSFSTGTRGFVATGGSDSYVYDDTYELLPYELEEE